MDHIIDLHLLTMIYKPSHAQAVKLLVKELYSLQQEYKVSLNTTDNCST